MRKLLYTFRSKIFVYFLLAALVPMVLSSLLLMHLVEHRLNSNLQEEAQLQTAELSQELNSLSDAFSQAAESLQSNPLVMAALSGAETDERTINSLLYRATLPGQPFAVFDLYDFQGRCLYSTGDCADAPVLNPDWGLLRGAASRGGEPFYYACEDPSNSLTPLLYCGALLQCKGFPNSGFLVMRVSISGFHYLLDGKYAQNDLLVLSSFFRPIYGSRSFLNCLEAPKLRTQLLNGTLENDDAFFVTVVQHTPTGLFLVLRQSTAFIHSTIRLLSWVGAACLLGSFVIAILISLQLSRQLSTPLQRIKEAFDRVEQDDLNVYLPITGQDEIAALASRFNTMVSALKSNRKELLQNQQELQEAQIRMMQAQLNPHFLGNTLDTMKWISKINRVPQVATMSTNLADILRFCISSEEFVPLYQELDILERYIEIQRIRLSDDFAYTTDISEELYDCMVPKMILQPIVENAILHGLTGVEGSAIRVSAQEISDTRFRITVTDNGKGFPPDMVGRPYRRDKDLAKGHLGLYNVDTILIRYYGEDCGLYLDQGEGGIGASVTACLPIHYEEDRIC